MKIWPLAAICLFVFTFIPQKTFSQTTASDSLFYQTAINNAIELYKYNTSDQLEVFHGRTYVPYPFDFQGGSPFFGSSLFVDGALVYEGINYNSIPLLYDDVATILLTQVKNGWIQLTNEKINAFTISNHHFIHLQANKNISAGFYERIYDGKYPVYKIENKKIREDLTSGKTVEHYVDKTIHYYLQYGNDYFEIKHKSDLYKKMPLYKQQLQEFIRKNKLNLRRDLENSMIKIAGYISQLPNKSA